MPCTVYNQEELAVLSAKRNAELEQQTIDLATQVNELTAMLCRLLGSLLDAEVLTYRFSKREISEFSQWYEKHKTHDEARIAREALAKLSEREKKVLGLTGGKLVGEGL